MNELNKVSGTPTSFVNGHHVVMALHVSGRKDLDLDEKDEDGKTAEDYARDKDNLAVLGLIR
jgi:hypothetical protein